MQKEENAERVSALIIKFRRALADVIPDDDLRREVSFHLSDVRDEIRDLDQMFGKIEAGDSVSNDQLQHLYYLFCVHWPYHSEELKTLLEDNSAAEA